MLRAKSFVLEPSYSTPVHISEESLPKNANGVFYPLPYRIFFLAILLAAELGFFSVWLFHTTRPVATKHDWAALLLRSVVCFTVIFVPFGFLKNRAPLEETDARFLGTARSGMRWGLLAVHFAALIAGVQLSALLYMDGGLRKPDVLSATWLAAWCLSFCCAALAFVSWPVWVELIRRAPRLWAYTSLAVVSAIASGPYFRRLFWEPGVPVRLTFRLVEMLLSPFVPVTIADASKARLGTEHFRVQILPGCSGVEGIGMVLAFVTLWLIVFRKDYRFPRSLLLIPIGIALIFLLNAMRIAALVLIGNAGGQDIALNGFHSQAGWIAFSVVAVAFCTSIQWLPWFSEEEPARKTDSAVLHDAAPAYLVPFLVIMAASMIANAAKGSDGVEWLYPLRFIAAAGALWMFRRSYAGFTWQFDWLAPLAGVGVFAIWLAFDRSGSTASDQAISSVLQGSSAAFRGIWIAFRVLAAVVTVPLAEELAFRGFLMRRLISERFESVPLKTFSWFAIVVSSLAFGLLHGGFWIAGSVAGILFALLTIRRGRISEAVIAHATSNALLAAYVLTYHKWHLW